MATNKRKTLLQLLFLFLIFTATIFLVFRGENFRQVLFLLSNADLRFIIPGLLCVLFFILGESLVLCYLMRTLGTRVPFLRCCRYSFIGFFYCCITPSASGGQPMQMMAMREDQIPVAVSTVVLAVVTITYKLVLVLIGLVVLILRPPTLMLYLEPAMHFMYLGMALNIAFIAVLILLVFHQDMVRALSGRLFALWRRLRPSGDPEKQTARLDRVLAQYQGSAEYLRTHVSVVIKVFVITFVQRFLLFLVTWFTYRSFSLSGHSLPLITTLQAMISMAADMIPLPGGMGISEALFLDIFQPIFGVTLDVPGMVISRGISYYTQLFLCGLMMIVFSLIDKRERKA